MLEIIGGQKELVAQWISERIPQVTTLPGGYEAIGVGRDGYLVGGALFTNYRPCPDGGDIEVWCAGKGWLSRRVIRAILSYPFLQLGCHRLTALTPKSNKPSRHLLEGLGFTLEGVARQGFGPRSHACLYSMLRGECRWIGNDDGKIGSSVA